MSAISQQRPERYQCNHCGEHADAHTFYDEAMCSRECRKAADAETIFNKLEHDHTVCFTCFRKLKTVLRPREYHPDVFIGYEFWTQFAEWGERSPDRESELEEDELNIPPKDEVVYAYEIHDTDADGNQITREYTPGQKYDHAHDKRRDPVLDPRDRDVKTGTTCRVCGATDHYDVDETLRGEVSTMLVGHHATERFRELHVNYDEERFWDAYTAGNSVRDALEMALRV